MPIGTSRYKETTSNNASFHEAITDSFGVDSSHTTYYIKYVYLFVSHRDFVISMVCINIHFSSRVF